MPHNTECQDWFDFECRPPSYDPIDTPNHELEARPLPRHPQAVNAQAARRGPVVSGRGYTFNTVNHNYATATTVHHAANVTVMSQGSFQVNSAGSHNRASATTIHHAANVTVVSQGSSRDDLILLGTLPRHPDVSGEWKRYAKNSRDTDLKEIWGWVGHAQGKELIMWIHGAPGLGKTTLARRLKDEARSRNLLAAAIFLSRLSTDSRWGPETFVRLIAGEIGRTHPKAVPAIARGIRRCHGAPSRIQLECLIRDPLLSLKLPYPLIVIVDTIEGRESHTRCIEHLVHLAPYTSLIRFVVFGRSQPETGRCKGILIHRYHLAPVPVDAMARYLETSFNAMPWKQGGRPTPEDVLRLSLIADGLFSRVEDIVSIFRGLSPSNCEDLSRAIAKLAALAYHRFTVSKLAGDVDEAILAYRICLVVLPSGQQDGRGTALNDLGCSLRRRFLAFRSVDDLEEAILLCREALDLRPPGHPNRHYVCYNLSSALHDRYRAYRLADDLDQAISLGREAVSLRPQGHSLRFCAVENLRMYLENRFEVEGSLEDIQEAITCAEEAISICPKDHRNYATLPCKLARYRGELDQVQQFSSL